MKTDGPDRKWAVMVEGIDEAVGFTRFTGSAATRPRARRSIMGDDRIAGRGVGREAERLANKRAYEEFGAHKVYGRIPAPNEAAKKAVIYNGWTHEGVLRNHIRHDGELIDVELWGGFPEDHRPSPRAEASWPRHCGELIR